MTTPSSPMPGAFPDTVIDSITVLLQNVRDGNDAAWDRIYGLIYQELRRIASRQLRQYGQSQSPTSVISLTWMRVAGSAANAENKHHLVSLFARAMRYTIIDEVRRDLAGKRGPGAQHIELNDETSDLADHRKLDDLVMVDQLLTKLAEASPRMVTIVELRFFGGLTEKEIGELLDLNERTVRRDWEAARDFLVNHMDGNSAPA